MTKHSTDTRKICAALIDMDGTLYDSMPNHARAWKRLMDEKGITCTEDEFFMYEGMTGAAIIDMMLRRHLGRPATDDEKTGYYALKARYFVEQPAVNPMPGAQALVEALRSRGIDTVLVTGSGQNSLLARLEKDYPGAFPESKRVTSASVSHGKPHPEPFLRGLELAGVDAARVIAIDNAPLGTRSGRDAGVFTVGVVTGPISDGALALGGAHIVYDSMEECAKMLPELLDKIEEISSGTPGDILC